VRAAERPGPEQQNWKPTPMSFARAQAAGRKPSASSGSSAKLRSIARGSWRRSRVAVATVIAHAEGQQKAAGCETSPRVDGRIADGTCPPGTSEDEWGGPVGCSASAGNRRARPDHDVRADTPAPFPPERAPPRRGQGEGKLSKPWTRSRENGDRNQSARWTMSEERPSFTCHATAHMTIVLAAANLTGC